MTSKWYGKVGFGITKEVKKGVWRPVIEEREYYGNVITLRKTASNRTNSTNDELTINSKISIIDDGYLSMNCTTIRYVEFMGAKWKVTDITPEPPRLVLTLGGVYVDNSDE